MKWIAFFIVLLGFAATASAQELTGRVVDAADGRPVAGAIVLAADSTGHQAGYTTSGADGTYRLRPRAGRHVARIEVSMMGYRTQRFDAARLPREIRLEAGAVTIREVEIRAPRLSLRGDTVSYNVASFTEAQDRTIADVLRKMPGIEVEKTGEIRYNGKAINRFYIDGLDMLDGRYGLATNNIAPQDVASVEVMENHQPIKALRDMIYSDRAALNLRLKKQARAHWTGTLRAAAGASTDEVLWNGSAFAMRIASGSQSMYNVKGENTGGDPTADLRQLSVDDLLNGGANRYATPEWFSTGLSEAPLDDRRTRMNRSLAASADNLWKLSDDYQLNAHVACAADRTQSDYAARTVRYLSDGERIEELGEQARLRNRQVTAQVRLQANTERVYLRERLAADLVWSDFRSLVSGTYPNRQQSAAPAFRVENDLDYIRRTGRHAMTVTSNMLWLTQPQQLDVVREGSAQRQQLDVGLLRMNHNAAWDMQAGRRWSFRLKGGVAGLLRDFESTLTGVATEAAHGDARFGYVGPYVQPAATFRSSRLRLTCELPAAWRHYWSGTQQADLPVWDSRIMARWEVSAYWALSASASTGQAAPDDSRIYPCVLLRDYRTLCAGTSSLEQAWHTTFSAAANYKNPLDGLFAYLMAWGSRSRLPLLATQRFEGDYLVSGWAEQTTSSSSWQLSAGISKNLDALHGQAGLDASFMNADAQMLQEGSRMPYRNRTLTLSPRINLRFARWINAEYRLNYRYTQLKIEGSGTSARHAADQRLTVSLSPTERLVIRLTGEHYYTQLSDTQSKHLLLADASVSWKIGERWELSATAANLLGETAYAYTLFDALSSSSCRYAIRPRDLYLGATWRF